MDAGIWFWVIYVMCVIFGAYFDWPINRDYRPLGRTFVIFVLIVLLGWRVFGPPIR